MKAIETRYKGYRFRSRLEARWAVFFDTLGIAWEYEPEGFEWGAGVQTVERENFDFDDTSEMVLHTVRLRGGRYLPDFWLPTFSGGMYVEVKPMGGDFTKAIEFAIVRNVKVWLAEGIPSYRSYNVAYGEYLSQDDEGLAECAVWDCVPYMDEDRMWTQPAGGNGPEDLEGEWFDDDLLVAVKSARSARFEHGEKP